MEKTFLIVQAVLALLFILSVLFQKKGSSLSLTFGGDGNNTFYGSKQGLDKFLAYSSYILGVLFVGNALYYQISLLS
jgi:protein translocase SecG subunit